MTLNSADTSLNERTLLKKPVKKKKILDKYICIDNYDGFTLIEIGFIIFTIVFTIVLGVQIGNGVFEVKPYGAVSSDDRKCSKIGTEAIALGGSAADSAVTTFLCLSVTHPHLVSFGGGGLIFLRNHKTNETKIFDFMNQYLAEESTSGIPGFVKGLRSVHKMYGHISWQTLFKPAINVAKNGFMVSKSLADGLKEHENLDKKILDEFSTDGKIVEEGQLLQRKKYAEILENISIQKSHDEFIVKYGPEIASSLEIMHANPLSALRRYNVVEHETVQKTFEKFSVITVGSPFAGSRILSGLDILQESPVTSQLGEKELYSTLANVSRLVISKSNESELVRNVTFDDFRVAQISIVDTFDLYIGGIATLGSNFGSGKMTSSGIIMNGLTNVAPIWKHGRRLSPIVPLFASKVPYACGKRLMLSSGSWQSTLQTMTQIIFKNKTVEQAIDAPRVYVENQSNSSALLIDDGANSTYNLPASVRSYLEKVKELKLQPKTSPEGVYGVSKTGDKLEYVSDRRLGGEAVAVGEEE